MQPLISIVIPVYNAEKYLSRCVESIIDQTYKNLEIILVDDGSLDNSGGICDDYAEKDNRIKVIHTENNGAGLARKIGIKASAGNYIGFVDSDDWIDNHMYQYMMELMIEQDVELVQTGFWLFSEGEKVSHGVGENKKYCQSDSANYCGYTNLFNFYNVITPNVCNKLFKRYTVEKYYLNIPDEIIYGEDAACVYAAIPFIDSVYVSDEIFYNYNQNNDNSVCKGVKTNINYVNDVMRLHKHLSEAYQSHKEKDILIEQLSIHTMKLLVSVLPKDIHDRLIHYYFPISDLGNNTNVIIYGAGKVGTAYYRQFKKYSNINIVSVVDKGKSGDKLGNMLISSVDILTQKEFDYIIIALLQENLVNEIIENLSQEHSIPKEKIIWKKPIHIVDEIII